MSVIVIATVVAVIGKSARAAQLAGASRAGVDAARCGRGVLAARAQWPHARSLREAARALTRSPATVAARGHMTLRQQGGSARAALLAAARAGPASRGVWRARAYDYASKAGSARTAQLAAAQAGADAARRGAGAARSLRARYGEYGRSRDCLAHTGPSARRMRSLSSVVCGAYASCVK